MSLPLEKSEGVSAKRHLIEVIDTMSEDECAYVLNRLEKWAHKNRRKHSRDHCMIPVDCATEKQAFEGFIRNLSYDGVFIQAQGNLEVGEEVMMTFSASNQAQPAKIAGEIVRRNMMGIGVRFNAVIADSEKETWIDCRSQKAEVGEDKRLDPRAEFRCPVEIEGVGGEMVVTDISLGGVFVECHFAFRERFKVNQTIRLRMSLPMEEEAVAAEARIVSFSHRGMHCKFVGLSPKSQDAVRCCFNIAKNTLPLR